MLTVYTTVVGNNADLIAEVARLYLPDGAVVVDPTYGKGVFWRKIDPKRIKRFCAYDISPHPKADRSVVQGDMRKLPNRSNTVDVVVLDPPYVHNPGTLMVDANYQNAATTTGMYHDDIIDLYQGGMTEARRILKPGGTLWIKCKDEIESGWQRWALIEIYTIAIKLGFFGKDLFILIPHGRPFTQRPQQHARKQHSYLWIFKLPTDKELKQVSKNNSKYRHGIWPKLDEQEPSGEA